MLSVDSLCLRYPGQRSQLLRDLSFSLAPGELLWLQGPNGSGKTSLLNCLSGVIPQRIKAESSGSVSLFETNICSLPLNEKFRHLAYQMSDPDNQLFFPRIDKELSFSLENAGLPAAEMLRRMELASARFGLAGFARVEPGQLSRGQKKLLVLAACAALGPQLYLLDEPTSELGSAAQELVLDWLREVLALGKIVVAAGHDPGLGALASRWL